MSQAAWQVHRHYSASTRELTRLTGICQAPVIQHISETIFGSTTIRCFEQESRFNEMNMQLIDKYSQPKLSGASAMEWLSFRLGILSSTIFAFGLIFSVSFPSSFADPNEYFNFNLYVTAVVINFVATISSVNFHYHKNLYQSMNFLCLFTKSHIVFS